MAEGFKVGTAYIQVDPDTEGFAEKVRADVEEAVAGIEAKVRIGADASDLDTKADQAREKIQGLDEERAEPSVGLDKSEFDTGADKTKTTLGGLGDEHVEPTVGLDDEPAQAQIAELRRQLAVLQAQKAGIEIDADASQADVKIAGLQAKISQLNAERADPQADLDDAAATAHIDELRAKLAQLKLQKAGIVIDADASEAEVKIATLQAQIRALQEESDSLDLGGGGGGSGGFEMPGGMLTYLGTGLAALAPGIGGAATGLGLLGGTGALAFGGISKALDEAHQSALNVGMTSQQVAAQQFANATAVQQAQESIAQATQQSAEDQVTSAASVRQALQGIGQAQQGVQEADYNLTEAQYGLSQAWQQAREQITQLDDALADSKISVQAASLAVQQAEYQQILTDQNAYSTSLDRQQAALAVVQAQQQLKDAQDSETASAYAANLANQQGVAGSQTVIQAKQGVTQATYAQQNAQQAYQNAVQNAALAQTEAAFTQARDAQAVANAQQNLSNTIEEQKLQWASAMSTENQAANQFAKDMARLTPAGRGFVNAVLALTPAFRGLETAAQNSVLPGMTVWLNGIAKLLPTVQSGVTRMGQAMSTAFAQFGKQMATPAFAKVLNGLISQGIKFADIVLPALAGFIQELAVAGSKTDAVAGLANLLAGLADGLTNLVKGLTPFEGALSSVFSVLGSALSDIGGPLGQVIGSLASALAPALQGLLPGFKALADAIGSGLGIALRGTAPLLGVLAQIISKLVIAFSPLLPQLGTMIAQLAGQLVPVLRALEPAILTIAQITMQQAGPSMQMLSMVLTDVLPPLARLIVAIAPLINMAARAALVVTEWGNDLTGVLIQGLRLAAEAVVSAASTWRIAWSGLEQATLFLWHNVLDPFYQAIVTGARQAVAGLRTTWDSLEAIFKAPVNFLIGTVYDKGIATLWNDVVTHIGLSSIKLPVIPTLAGGGIVPGTDKGYDSQLVMMRPQEGVLVPGAVDAIGGPPAIHALNRAHGGTGQPGRAGGLPGFQGGGVLGGIGGFVSGVGHGIASLVSGGIDIAKIVAAVATGNTTAFTNAASKLIGTKAAGDLGKIMTGIPRALITDLAKQLTGGSLGGGVSSPGHVTGTVAQWFAQAVKLAGVPASWIPGLETIARYESGDNPNAINLTDSNAAAGDPSRGIMQEIMTTFLAYHAPGTSMNIYDPVANIASAARYIRSRYGNPDRTPGLISLAHGGGYQGYDGGGWLQPGTLPVDQTGRPEAVLTPEESAAFVTIARRLSAQGTGTMSPVNNFNYFGPQAPTPEQKAIMMRDLAMTLSGAR